MPEQTENKKKRNNNATVSDKHILTNNFKTGVW